MCLFSSNNFLNIKFANIYFENCLITSQNYEKIEKKKVLLDYGGFNIGKALHVGHVRSLNIGRSLKKCLEFVGYDVNSDIHYGDWGVQMAQIISYIEEENIYNLINSFSKEIIEKGNCEKSQDYLINCLIRMNEPISLFFDNVIVNHNDFTIKTNRLKLLNNLK